MITLLTGEDSFAIAETLRALEAAFDGTAERYEGSNLELRQLPDVLMGSSLFAEKRLVILRDLSQNSSLWQKLPEWLPRVSDDIHLVIVDAKPDKRTTSYKALKDAATVQDFAAWGDRDGHLAEAWIIERAKTENLSLDKPSAHYLVERVGHEKWNLAKAIEILSLAEAPVTKELIDRLIEAHPSANIFSLFENALNGRVEPIRETLRTLELQDDPYALFALLLSQALQLASLSYAKSDDTPEKDFAIHPFVASKLRQQASRLGNEKVAAILKIIATTDADLKRSRGEPWLLIEQTLLKVAAV